MKTAWKVFGGLLLCFILLRIAGSVASNQRLVNKLNPVWEVRGQVLTEDGKPISDVDMHISYDIGYYAIGRIIEQSARSEREVIRPDTNGFFGIRKQCAAILIRVEDPRYQIVPPPNEFPVVMFSRDTEAWGNPLIHNSSDKNFKLILKPGPRQLFAKIQIGMPRSDVDAILGAPAIHHLSMGNIQWYLPPPDGTNGLPGQIGIRFTPGDRVESKQLNPDCAGE
jgi:hypothetical protein